MTIYDYFTRCPTCYGSGRLHVRGDSRTAYTTVVCWHCYGRGTVRP